MAAAIFSQEHGLQNQSVLYTGPSLPGEARPLLDPNTLSKDGTVALSGIDVTDDGKLLAYGLAIAGSDWQEWKVRDIETGQDLSDDVKWVKFSAASWKHDGSGFFYSRYDAPASADELKQTNYFHKLYFHKLGTPQAKDELIYERRDHKDWNFSAKVTEDGRILVITVSQGTDPKNRIFYKDLASPNSKVVELLNKQDASYTFIGYEGNAFWFTTDLNAPRGRIVAIDILKPGSITTVVPEAADKLESVDLVGDRFIASYLKDAHSVVRLFDLSGKPAGEIPLPGLGTVSGFTGKRKDMETFYSYVSFTEPPTVYRYDVKTGQSAVLFSPKVDFKSDEFTSEQQRRFARWRNLKPAPGLMGRGSARGGRDGHAPVPKIHNRLGVELGLRFLRKGRRVCGALQVFAPAQRQARSEVPAHLDYDRRS